MIVGNVYIDHPAGVLETTNDSYPLDRRTVFSVLLPFRALGWMSASLLGSFCLGFHDLLWVHEIVLCVALGSVMLWGGETVAQLVLSNRDLRGSDLCIACWGSYSHLNQLRRQLALAARATTDDGGMA